MSYRAARPQSPPLVGERTLSLRLHGVIVTTQAGTQLESWFFHPHQAAEYLEQAESIYPSAKRVERREPEALQALDRGQPAPNRLG